MPGAFTLLEVLMTIALIGVLVAVVVNSIGPTMTAGVQSSKLEADVVKLNQMVQLYVADGGSFSGLSSEQAVLDKMKMARPRAEQNTNVGVSSGHLIDVRLRARAVTGPFAFGQKHRAKWFAGNPTATPPVQPRFMLVSSGSGVDEFYLDESLTDAVFAADSRAASKQKLNANNGWIWGSTAADTTFAYVRPGAASSTSGSNAFDPVVAVPSGSGAGAGAGAGSGAGAGAGAGSGSGSSGTGSTPTALPTPSINPVGGTFAYAAFPSTAVITNGGAPGGAASALYYRVNAGAWQTYSSSVNLNSGDRIEAKNVALLPTYADSAANAQEYYRLVGSFAGSGAGEWNNVGGGPDLAYNITPGDPTASFSHGAKISDFDTGQPSTITYTKNNFSGVQANTPFTLGELSILNGSTATGSEATSVTLSVNLNFASPALSRVVDINFILHSTENTGLAGDRLTDADTVEIATPSPLSVTLDGVTYTLNLSWVTLDPGAGVVQGNKFYVFELSDARAQLRATLVSNH